MGIWRVAQRGKGLRRLTESKVRVREKKEIWVKGRTEEMARREAGRALANLRPR